MNTFMNIKYKKSKQIKKILNTKKVYMQFVKTIFSANYLTLPV